MTDSMPETDDAARQLLDYLERQRAQRCEQVLARAEGEAQELRREARRGALALVREAVRRERSRREARLREERARIDARFRRELFRQERDSLEHARASLAEALVSRWREGAGARQEWLQITGEQALVFLPDGGWRVEHPAGWDHSEARPARDALSRLRPDVDIELAEGKQKAGLLVSCGSASVDTRPEGLMADQARLNGLLLRALERENQRSTEEDA